MAIAIGALVGGVVAGRVGERPVTVVGVVVSIAALWRALGWGVGTELDRITLDLAVFGAGFGLTVDGFWWGVLGALVLGLISWLIGILLRPLMKKS